jgi:hypothetical protein
MFDIVGEALSIDRLIEHAGRIDPIMAQGSKEGRRASVAIPATVERATKGSSTASWRGVSRHLPVPICVCGNFSAFQHNRNQATVTILAMPSRRIDLTTT